MDRIFWINDPSILYKDGRYTEIIPTIYMTRVEQLNAVTRFCLYYIILLILFGRDRTWYYLPIAIIIFVIILYALYRYDPLGRRKEEIMERKQIEENFGSNADVFYEGNPQYELESGYYDAGNNLIIGQDYDVHTNREKELAYTLDELVQYQNASCKKPTPDNPFMNPTLTEYNTEDPPSACNANDDDIKTQVERNFKKNLYMDIDDLFNIQNSQRQFYTIPVPSIPPDQGAFANWCYKTPLTCKENQEYCLRYEDLRFTSRSNGIR